MRKKLFDIQFLRVLLIFSMSITYLSLMLFYDNRYNVALHLVDDYQQKIIMITQHNQALKILFARYTQALSNGMLLCLFIESMIAIRYFKYHHKIKGLVALFFMCLVCMNGLYQLLIERNLFLLGLYHIFAFIIFSQGLIFYRNYGTNYHLLIQTHVKESQWL